MIFIFIPMNHLTATQPIKIHLTATQHIKVHLTATQHIKNDLTAYDFLFTASFLALILFQSTVSFFISFSLNKL